MHTQCTGGGLKKDGHCNLTKLTYNEELECLIKMFIYTWNTLRLHIKMITSKDYIDNPTFMWWIRSSNIDHSLPHAWAARRAICETSRQLVVLCTWRKLDENNEVWKSFEHHRCDHQWHWLLRFKLLMFIDSVRHIIILCRDLDRNTGHMYFHANLTPHGHHRSFDNESMSSYVIEYEYDQT